MNDPLNYAETASAGILLSENALAVLGLIAFRSKQRGEISVGIATIHDETGIEPDSVLAALDELADARLCSTWTAAGDPVCTLSPLSAARLGIKVVSIGGRARWVRSGYGEGKQRVARERHSDWDFDRTPGGYGDRHDEIDAADIIRRLPSLRDIGRPPRPYLFRGVIGSWKNDDGPCEFCCDIRLSTGEYCLKCDRFWLDDRMPKIKIPKPLRGIPA